MSGSLLRPPGEDIFPSPSLTRSAVFARGLGGVARRPRPAQPDLPDSLESAPEPVPDPAPENPPRALLSRGRWLQSQSRRGEVVRAEVDVILPEQSAHLTRVVFLLFEALPDGSRRERARNEAVHARDGKAACDFLLPERAVDDTPAASEANFHFVARHVHAEEHQGPPLRVLPGKNPAGFDTVLYYSPFREKYLELMTPEEYLELQAEADSLSSLQGAARKAMEGDESDRLRKLREASETAEQVFGGGGLGKAGGAFEELVLVRGNPRWGEAKSWIYIRSHVRGEATEVKGYWRKESEATLRKNLDDLLKKAPGSKEHSPLLTGDISQRLFASKPKAGEPLRWYRKEKRGELAGQVFQFTKEAALVRFAYGFDGKLTGNWKERKVRVGASGLLTYGLLEGRMTGEIPSPEEGLNLLSCLREVKRLDHFLTVDRVCLFRVKVILGAQAFAGLSVQGALSFPHLELSKENPGEGAGSKAKVGGTGSGLLGIQGSESLAVKPEWSPTRDPFRFEALGKAQADIGATVGLAGEARIEIAWEKGKLRFRLGAGAALGIGPRGGITFEVAMEEGWKLLGHLLNSVDYHRVGEVTGEAFEAYKNYCFSLMIAGKAALIDGAALAGEVVGDFQYWLAGVGKTLSQVKQSLAESSYYSATLSKVPPEALGQALITLMQSHEAGDSKVILGILYSTVRREGDPELDPSANHKLKWTLREASGMAIAPISDPSHEPQKEVALKAGIRRIREFGNAGGLSSFVRSFDNFLSRNGIQP